MRSSSSNKNLDTIIVTNKNKISIQRYSPKSPSWFVWHDETQLHIDMDRMWMETDKREITYIGHGDHKEDYVGREYAVRRSKNGDWMRREKDSLRPGYDPCPGWIGEVLDAITEYLVNKAIVE